MDELEAQQRSICGPYHWRQNPGPGPGAGYWVTRGFGVLASRIPTLEEAHAIARELSYTDAWDYFEVQTPIPDPPPLNDPRWSGLRGGHARSYGTWQFGRRID